MKNFEQSLQAMTTVNGQNVAELSTRQPILLVFLRHFGCTFCREALSDLSARREEIDRLGSKLVLVHMTDPATALPYFTKYDLVGVAHVCDPDCRYYQAFGLTKGTARQLFGLQTWIRGFQAGVMDGHGVGTSALGDGFQMPGVFVIVNGHVRESFVHKLAGDRPEYLNLLSNCCEVPE